MWKTEKNNQVVLPPQPDRGNGSHEDAHVIDGEWPDTGRAASSLDDLRNQPGFGVVVSSSEIQPPAAPAAPTSPNNIGNRMSGELDGLSRRERQVREMKELATNRVVDLTTEQLRRILEFMA